MRVTRRLVKNVAMLVSGIVLSVFFSREYLRGRWFDDNIEGWKWAWRGLFFQKIVGFNRSISWPVAPFTVVLKPHNIDFHVDDLNNFQNFGCYFQNSLGRISIGHGTFIGPNVGIITANHKAENLQEHMPSRDVRIGKQCWIGMNCVILPGVVLGPHTIVGAESIVTKSFP